MGIEQVSIYNIIIHFSTLILIYYLQKINIYVSFLIVKTFQNVFLNFLVVSNLFFSISKSSQVVKNPLISACTIIKLSTDNCSASQHHYQVREMRMRLMKKLIQLYRIIESNRHKKST